MITRRLLLALPLWIVTLPAAEAGQASLQDAIFAHGPFAAVDRPTRFVYRYVLRSLTMPEPYVSEARMEVREVRSDGKKLVWFDMFEGPNYRSFGPMAAEDQNPMVFVFLQRDVTTMANLTGGAAGYFQQQIRRAFTKPVEVEPVTVIWQGRAIAASRLQLQPFAADPQIDRFPQFREKTYEFVVAPEIPGGFYRLATRVPNPQGGVVLEEVLTLTAVGG